MWEWGGHKHETWVPTLQKSAVNNPKLEGAHLHPLVSGGLPLIKGSLDKRVSSGHPWPQRACLKNQHRLWLRCDRQPMPSIPVLKRQRQVDISEFTPPTQENQGVADQMAQQVKTFAMKHGHLISTPRIYMVEGESQLPSSCQLLQMCPTHSLPINR